MEPNTMGSVNSGVIHRTDNPTEFIAMPLGPLPSVGVGGQQWSQEQNFERMAADLLLETEANEEINGHESESDTVSATSESSAGDKEDALADYKCVICLGVFINTCGIACSHKFCRHCINKWLRAKSDPVCPICRDAVVSSPDTLPNIDKEIEAVYARLPQHDQKQRAANIKRRNMEESIERARYEERVLNLNRSLSLEDLADLGDFDDEEAPMPTHSPPRVRQIIVSRVSHSQPHGLPTGIRFPLQPDVSDYEVFAGEFSPLSSFSGHSSNSGNNATGNHANAGGQLGSPPLVRSVQTSGAPSLAQVNENNEPWQAFSHVIPVSMSHPYESHGLAGLGLAGPFPVTAIYPIACVPFPEPAEMAMTSSFLQPLFNPFPRPMGPMPMATHNLDRTRGPILRTQSAGNVHRPTGPTSLHIHHQCPGRSMSSQSQAPATMPMPPPPANAHPPDSAGIPFRFPQELPARNANARNVSQPTQTDFPPSSYQQQEAPNVPRGTRIGIPHVPPMPSQEQNFQRFVPVPTHQAVQQTQPPPFGAASIQDFFYPTPYPIYSNGLGLGPHSHHHHHMAMASSSTGTGGMFVPVPVFTLPPAAPTPMMHQHRFSSGLAGVGHPHPPRAAHATATNTHPPPPLQMVPGPASTPAFNGNGNGMMWPYLQVPPQHQQQPLDALAAYQDRYYWPNRHLGHPPSAPSTSTRDNAPAPTPSVVNGMNNDLHHHGQHHQQHQHMHVPNLPTNTTRPNFPPPQPPREQTTNVTRTPVMQIPTPTVRTSLDPVRPNITRVDVTFDVLYSSI